MLLPTMTYKEMYDNLSKDLKKVKIREDYFLPKAIKEFKKERRFPAWRQYEYTVPASQNKYIIFFYVESRAFIEKPEIGNYCVVLLYKCTINKRITKRNNDEFIEKKNRYNKVYYNGFTIDVISLFMVGYFPMQNFLNIFPNTSSFVTSPKISLRQKIHSRISWDKKSPDKRADKPS